MASTSEKPFVNTWCSCHPVVGRSAGLRIHRPGWDSAPAGAHGPGGLWVAPHGTPVPCPVKLGSFWLPWPVVRRRVLSGWQGADAACPHRHGCLSGGHREGRAPTGVWGRVALDKPGTRVLVTSRGEGSQPSLVGALLDSLQNVLPSPPCPPHVDGETEAQTGEAAYSRP